jgi:ribosomal RNA-processing protein 1
MLIRRFVNATFRLLMRAKWDTDACREYNSILSGPGGPLWYVPPPHFVALSRAHDIPCSPEDIRVPTSLTSHLGDIYLEELDRALESSETVPAPLSTILAPFFTFLARTSKMTTYQHLQSALVHPLLTALGRKEDAESRARKRARVEISMYDHIVANGCVSDPLAEGRLDPGVIKNSLLQRIFNIASEQDTRSANRKRMYTLWRELSGSDDDSPST